MPVNLDADRIRAIASSCRRSGDAIEQQAQAMNANMQELRQALSGVPHMRLEDKFAEWNSNFKQLSQALQESHGFLNSIADRIETLVKQL